MEREKDQLLKVVIRVRPPESLGATSGSIADESNNGFIVADEEQATISIERDKKGTSEFKFSGVLGSDATQVRLWEHCSTVVDDVVEGINTCVMAYGQTGSGKTFSMYGHGWEENAVEVSAPPPELSLEVGGSVSNGGGVDGMDSLNDKSGIIPRSIAALFEKLDKKATQISKFDFSVNCQIMQVYNEKIFDLLQDKKRENPLQLRESVRGSFSAVHVRGMSIYRVYSKDDVLMLLRNGLKNRATRATDFNQESSRSHTILQLFIQVEEPDEDGLMLFKRSTFSLVDLAGSEKWRPVLGQAGNSQLDMQKEMTNINSSLHVLGNCVSALIEPGRRHIPYRDSVLTRLLQDSLGGSGKTIIIATVREDAAYKEETYSTLQFASRASRIKVNVSISSSSMHDGMSLDEARKQINVLRGKLKDFQAAAIAPSQQSQQQQLPCSVCSTLKDQVAELTAKLNFLMDENKRLRQTFGLEASTPPSTTAMGYPQHMPYNNNNNNNTKEQKYTQPQQQPQQHQQHHQQQQQQHPYPQQFVRSSSDGMISTTSKNARSASHSHANMQYNTAPHAGGNFEAGGGGSGRGGGNDDDSVADGLSVASGRSLGEVSLLTMEENSVGEWDKREGDAVDMDNNSLIESNDSLKLQLKMADLLTQGPVSGALHVNGSPHSRASMSSTASAREAPPMPSPMAGRRDGSLDSSSERNGLFRDGALAAVREKASGENRKEGNTKRKSLAKLQYRGVDVADARHGRLLLEGGRDDSRERKPDSSSRRSAGGASGGSRQSSSKSKGSRMSSKQERSRERVDIPSDTELGSNTGSDVARERDSMLSGSRRKDGNNSLRSDLHVDVVDGSGHGHGHGNGNGGVQISQRNVRSSPINSPSRSSNANAGSGSNKAKYHGDEAGDGVEGVENNYNYNRGGSITREDVTTRSGTGTDNGNNSNPLTHTPIRNPHNARNNSGLRGSDGDIGGRDDRVKAALSAARQTLSNQPLSPSTSPQHSPSQMNANDRDRDRDRDPNHTNTSKYSPNATALPYNGGPHPTVQANNPIIQPQATRNGSSHHIPSPLVLPGDNRRDRDNEVGGGGVGGGVGVGGGEVAGGRNMGHHTHTSLPPSSSSSSLSSDGAYGASLPMYDSNHMMQRSHLQSVPSGSLYTSNSNNNNNLSNAHVPMPMSMPMPMSTPMSTSSLPSTTPFMANNNNSQFDFGVPCAKHGLEQCILCQVRIHSQMPLFLCIYLTIYNPIPKIHLNQCTPET